MKNKMIFKLICCMLVLVFCVSFFVGCGTDIFAIDNERYREVEVMTIGDNIVVTMGEIIDWFSLNASSYISQGYEVQAIWDALFPQFVEQRIFMNEAIIGWGNAPKNTSAIAQKYKFGEYMVYKNGNDKFVAGADAEFATEADHQNKLLVYYEKSVYLSLLEAFDSATESRLKDKGYVFNDAETAATRADMIGKDGAITKSSLWEDEYDISSALKETNQKLEKYQTQDFSGTIKYVFGENDPKLQDAIDRLNDRINTDEEDAKTEVTKSDYIAAQKYAVNIVIKNIKSSNNREMADYLKRAIEEQIADRLAKVAQMPYYEAAENSITLQSLNARLQNLKAQFLNNYAKDRASFESFVKGLSSSSYIYDVPQAHANQYHYVMNLLLPFSDEQKAELNDYSTNYGSNSTTYLEQRFLTAKQIEIKKYSSSEPEGATPEDSDTYKTVDDFVAITRDSISVNDSIKNLSQNEFRQLIYSYGTDPGSLNPTYNYVIGLNDYDLADQSKETFVKEFAAAARTLANNCVANPNADKAIAAVTTYGIHIMYYVGPVVQDVFEPTTESEFNTWKLDYGIEGGNAMYRFYKAYFEEIKSTIVEQHKTATIDTYKAGEQANRKVVINEKELSKYLKQYGAEFTNNYK